MKVSVELENYVDGFDFGEQFDQAQKVVDIIKTVCPNVSFLGIMFREEKISDEIQDEITIKTNSILKTNGIKLDNENDDQ